MSTRWKALDEIYKIYMRPFQLGEKTENYILVHRSDLNISAKNKSANLLANGECRMSCYSNIFLTFQTFSAKCAIFTLNVDEIVSDLRG